MMSCLVHFQEKTAETVHFPIYATVVAFNEQWWLLQACWDLDGFGTHDLDALIWTIEDEVADVMDGLD